MFAFMPPRVPAVRRKRLALHRCVERLPGPHLRTTRAAKEVLAWAAVILLAAGGCARRPAVRPNSTDAPLPREASEWPAYGGDHGGLRYSDLDDIRRENVGRLEIAWTYRHGDVLEASSPLGVTSFQATPILVDGILYFPTPLNRVIALDPATGAEHWTYDPEIDRSGNYAYLMSRGVAVWRGGDRSADERCASRIFTATRDASLIALDAETGEPCSDFGENGRIDLNPAVGPQILYGEYGVTSPPEVIGNNVVVGSLVADNLRTDAPSGVVRAYDVSTGALRWAWDLAPPGYDYSTRPVSAEGYALGTPNVWAPMSSDPERDLLFVPTGNPAPDLYRGEHPEMDFYGSSVVALRGSTGEVVWSFQTVHHDLWDYDVPAQPTLVDLIRDGEVVPALVQGTKMGLLFVLHRETGEPIFGVEERAVPQSGAPGERISPTQPFPLKPPPLVPHSLPPEDAWGITPFDRHACRKALEEVRNEGIYTPPGLDWALLYPSSIGGVNWGGVAVDPHRKMLAVNTSDLATKARLVPRAEFDAQRPKIYNPDNAPQDGTPFGAQRGLIASPLGAPCSPPPWGRLTAVDLDAGEILWERPLGTIRNLTPLPLDINLGVPNLGGPLITKGGLVFIGAALDDYLRAFALETGEELWRARLPAGGQATPMTYRVENAGGGPRQFVVIAAGGHGGFHKALGVNLGDSLVAFALPRSSRP